MKDPNEFILDFFEENKFCDHRAPAVEFIKKIQADAYNAGLKVAYQNARDVFYPDDTGLETFKCRIDNAKIIL